MKRSRKRKKGKLHKGKEKNEEETTAKAREGRKGGEDGRRI